MTEFWLALLGIAGTATSAIAINAQQNRAARDRAKVDAQRRQGDLRREAIATFAETLSDYRRAQLAAWFEAHADVNSNTDHDEVPSAAELRKLRASTWGALYRVRLLWDNSAVVEHAEALVEKASQLKKAEDKNGLTRRADDIRARLSDLVDAARRLA
jgi:hypothetical protein